MAGLGLTHALNQYQQGLAWKQDQEELARQKSIRDLEDAANARGAEVIAAAKRSHEASFAAPTPRPQQAPTTPGGMNDAETAGLAQPAPQAAPQAPPFRPTPNLLLKAYEARGQAFADAGDFKNFAMNEAKTAPLRQQIRIDTVNRAIQEFDADSDPIKLVKTVYDTAVFDGKTVKDAEYIKGGEGAKGAPSGPDVIRVTLSDGSTKMVNPLKVKDAALAMIRDPQAQQQLMEYEFKERLKAAVEAQKNIQVETEKARQKRETDAAKARLDLGLEGAKHGFKVQQIGMENASAEKRTAMSSGATVKAATLGKEGRVEAATLSAGKERDANKKDAIFDQLHDELTRAWGAKGPNYSLDGKLTSDEMTSEGAQYARELVRDGKTLTEALKMAGAEIKKRRAAKELSGVR